LHDEEEAQRRASTDEAAAGCLLRSCSDPAPGEDFPGVGLGAGAAARLIRRVVQELNDMAIISITASIACTIYMCVVVHCGLLWRSMMHHCIYVHACLYIEAVWGDKCWVALLRLPVQNTHIFIYLFIYLLVIEQATSQLLL
jgi:hypothetical protein